MASESPHSNGGERPTRAYDSPVRRRQVAQTTERILTAGAELAHEIASWDWTALTVRAVATRAGVGERTVYRHFASEHQLHDAVMARLEREAGVDYNDVALADVASISTKVINSLSSFAASDRRAQSDDPAFTAAGDRRRAALLRAVAEAAPHWSVHDREMAAAAIDVTWAVSSYELLTQNWGFDRRRSTAVMAWLTELTVREVTDNHPPAP